MSLPIPVFFDSEPTEIVNRMVARYEELTGRTLQPAQVERLLIDVMAYEVSLVRSAADEAAKQMLADFSDAPVLDYLGRNVGILARLAPAKAFCKVRFTLVDGHSQLVIPEGLRVQTTDGQKIFQTKVATTVLSSLNVVDIECECASEGTGGNGYAVNTVSTILDPQSYLTTATNITVTDGGSDEETDAQLAARIFLAFATSATAGSLSSYRFYARSANPQITDVYVFRPTPGTVQIYPMIGGGVETPQEILDQVYTVCNEEDIRPTTDTVIVTAPTPIDYEIEVELTILNTAEQSLIQSAVQSALDALVAERLATLGLDITLDKITALCMVDGVYSVNIVSPTTDLTVAPNEFAVSTGVSVTISATTNG